ncbi:thioredoxin [Candidatus Falkowbacteria bacterium]|nr:thioredoxin [Candidatus Falkowbacteria bacterium]
MSRPIDLTEKTFEKEVMNSELPVLVDFWAPWCGPCRMMAPILDALAESFSGKIKIVKLDVENIDHAELAERYKIQSIPNMKLFKDGQVALEFVGYRDQESFTKELSDALR